MDQILDKIDRLIKRRNLSWTRRGNRVNVELRCTGRKQKIHLKRDGEMYLFSSIVLGADHFRRRTKYRREVAYRAWRKNALKDLVTYTFDEAGNLMGVFEQPVATLDLEELLLYIETLAKECDRFEYILTGLDLE